MESLVKISLVFRVHPSEDVLEEYAFGRLSRDHLSTVEEHLLVCETCQTALEHTDQFIRLVKTATARDSRPRRRSVLAELWRSLGAGMPARTAVWVSVLGSACLMGVVLSPKNPAPLAAPAPLVSYRSAADGAAVNTAPALRPLDFSIRAEDVPAEPEYRLEVATASGEKVWTGPAKPLERELTARMTRGLKGGLYWVRLYDQNSVMLSEYGLRLK
jgi:hypothetical protein